MKVGYTRFYSQYALAGDNTLQTVPVAVGMVQEISHVSIMNANNTVPLVRITKASGGVLMPYREEDTPAAGKLYWADEKITLQATDYLIVTFSGCTLNDALSVWLDGAEMTLTEWRAH